MQPAPQKVFVEDAWQTPRNARTLRAFMALQNEEIAQRLVALRKAKGNPPQTVVASALGVGERTVQSWEQGEAKPGYRSLQKLAAYYGVGEDVILTGASRATPDLSLVKPDDDKLARIVERLDQLEIDVEHQNRNLQTQTEVLREIKDLLRVLTGQDADAGYPLRTVAEVAQILEDARHPDQTPPPTARKRRTGGQADSQAS